MVAEGTEFCVTAIGSDRPGIVAAVAEALVQVGGNVEDSAMTILGGQFAIVLLVATPADQNALTEALARHTDPFGLIVHVSPVTGPAQSAGATPTHVLSVYGADKPGILAGVTRALADVGANVTDLETRLLNPSGEAVWAMILELATDDADAVAATVDDVCGRLGVDHTLRAFDAETF